MSGILETLLSRLENVATRLEASEGRVSGGGGVGAPGVSYAPSATTTQSALASLTVSSSGPASASLQEWDSKVMSALKDLVSSGQDLGDEVKKVTELLQQAFQEERNVVAAVCQCQKPDQAGLQKLVASVGEKMGAISALADGRRTDAFNHFKAAAEAVHGLSWVVYTGPGCGMSLPPQHVDESWQSAEFFANKVLMQHRNTDAGSKHVAWVKALKDLFKTLQLYVKQHAMGGPVWNANGVPVSAFKGDDATAAAAPKPAQGPAPSLRAPPPPPPPAGGPGSLIKDAPATKPAAAPAAPAAGLSAMFADLSKGEGVTAGLRKVTADMKTKNRADRTSTVPGSAEPKAASKAPTDGPAISAKPPRTELEQGRKWVVEHHTDDREIVIEDANFKQSVYIFGCTSCTIQVKGKINAISMDSCKRSALVFEDVVATVELVNSSKLEIQAIGKVPTIAVDKCDGVQLYLPKESLEAAITTAKSSEVNIVIMGGPEDDPVEHYIPEQFLSTYKDGKFVTEPVSHGGG